MLEQFQNILQIFHYPLSFLPLLTVAQPFKDIFGNCIDVSNGPQTPQMEHFYLPNISFP